MTQKVIEYAPKNWAELCKENNPVASLALITYNHEKFIEAAIRGALAQDYSPLEIIISDDCSTDQTVKIAERLLSQYAGCHRVVLYKQVSNLGVSGNVNAVVNAAGSDIVVLAAGDDVSLPSRVARSVHYLDESTSAVCFSTKTFSTEQPPDWKCGAGSEVQAKLFTYVDYLRDPLMHLNGAARAFRRSKTFLPFGDINPNCPTEDSVILLRALLCGQVKLVNEVQVLYRTHPNSLSAPSNLKLMNFDLICEQYKADLLRAQTNEIVDQPAAKRLMQAVDDRHLANRLMRKFKSDNYRFRFFMLHVVPARCISARRKYRLFCTMMKYRLGSKS